MFKWGYPSPQWDNEMGSSPIRLLLELVLVLKMYPLVIKRCWLEIEHFIEVNHVQSSIHGPCSRAMCQLHREGILLDQPWMGSLIL